MADIEINIDRQEERMDRWIEETREALGEDEDAGDDE